MRKTLLHGISMATVCLLLSLICTSAFAYDVVVAKDGSGNYTTVQAAIDAAPTGRTTPYSIFIKNGKYKEKINIPSTKPFLQIIGESVANVILTYDDFSGKPIPGGGTYGTSTSASFTVRAADFTAINITFENTTGESPQALAIYVDGDRSAFKNCRFLGGQDTVYAGGNGARQYFRSCYIDGTVDFIFGDARAVFDSCVIYAKTRASAGASYITAANTKQTEPYGYVFRDSKIPANRGTTVYYLGRPWQNDAGTADAAKSWNKTVFLNTTMSSSIQPAGWSTWDAGTDVTKITYAEYRSKKFDSTLVDVSARAPWSKQLTATEANTYYNNSNLFGSWDPCSVTADFCTYTPEPIAVSNFKGVKGASTSSFTWNISWPIAGVKYEVLRSNDRTTFTKIAEQTSLNDSTVNYNYAEAVPPPGQTYYYLIQASKAGYATHISDTVIISSTPTINVTGSMGSFIQGVGTPSTSQTYVVSASSLTNNLIITAPTGYELSTNGSTWNTSSNPIVIVQDANGNIGNTTVYVRLNAPAAGSYSGDVIHASVGADTVRIAVTGNVQSEPLTVSEVLQWWPMTVSGADSAAVRSSGLLASTPTLSKLYLSSGTAVPTVTAYSPLHGQATSPSSTGNGLWTAAAGGYGNNLNRTLYEEFIITAASTHSVRVDSLLMSSSIYNSTGKLAVVYSLSGFATDSSDVSGGVGPAGGLAAGANGGFTTPVALTSETTQGTTMRWRFALNGGTGVTIASGQTITVRLYFSCGSSSTGRYAKIKDVQLKGLAIANPVAGDYRSHQTGNWTDLASWERWDGTTWVTPAPAYPVYNNATNTTILNGHTLTVSATLANGSGYIQKTKINAGGQVIVNAGANLNIANDGVASTADLQVDGTFTNFGGLFTNGNVLVVINGNFVHSGTGFNLSNTGDTVILGAAGIYQHNANSNSTPARLISAPTGTLLITGITSNQTGIFKNTSKYGNIVWNNAGQANYYAFRLTLDSSNVQGSFTVQNTGSTYIAFVNTSGRVKFPGGYYQTGGTVNFRESGTITDTLDLGGDFSVTGGSFISNMGTGSSLLVRLNGTNKLLTYAAGTATNINWEVNGSYTNGSDMTLPSGGFGVVVNGTLLTSTYAIGGAGNFVVNPGAVLGSGSPLGLNGNITTTGTKNLSTTASYIFNGSTAQVTGNLLPSTVNALTINNLSDVRLSGGNVTVTGAFTLNNGKLLVGNNTITSSSVLGSSSAKYVVTDGVGALKINNIGAGVNSFPVGPTPTSYNPVTLNNAGGSDNFSVNVKTTFDNPVPDANKLVNRQWTINEDVPGGSNVTVSLSWVAADQAPGFDPLVASSIIRYNGTSWQSYPATITGAGTTANPYVATASGITTFSPFTVINDAALPLSIVSFTGSYNNRVVTLNWKTANELGTKEFVVERSKDASNYTAIGTVRAANASGANQYSLVDASPFAGMNYYRLKMVDISGSSTYSKAVTINNGSKQSFTILANPVKDQLVISHTAAVGRASFRVVSADGREISATILQQGATRATINVSSLQAGIYVLIYENNGEKAMASFLKQ
jgi:pectin methylesterase-like acyl-CoA thioesterase